MVWAPWNLGHWPGSLESLEEQEFSGFCYSSFTICLPILWGWPRTPFICLAVHSAGFQSISHGPTYHSAEHSSVYFNYCLLDIEISVVILKAIQRLVCLFVQFNTQEKNFKVNKVHLYLFKCTHVAIMVSYKLLVGMKITNTLIFFYSFLKGYGSNMPKRVRTWKCMIEMGTAEMDVVAADS